MTELAFRARSYHCRIAAVGLQLLLLQLANALLGRQSLGVAAQPHAGLVRALALPAVQKAVEVGRGEKRLARQRVEAAALKIALHSNKITRKKILEKNYFGPGARIAMTSVFIGRIRKR